MKEKIIVSLLAEWNEEKGGWYVNTDCDFYRNKDVLRLHETSLIEACDEWVPAFALLELIGVEAEQVIGGKVLEEIERTKKWHKLK